MNILRFLYRTDTKQRYITDSEGRILMLRGVNANSSGKDDPERVGTATKEDFRRLSEDWGFNAVRLLIFWDAIEPDKGRFDDKYLMRVRERLDWCKDAGLKVILDMHQDLYSVKFGGDGAPDWAIIDGDHPFTYEEPWEKNYIHPAVKTAIDNFWNPKSGHGELREHYTKALLHSLTILGDHEAVIGIDLYNEPTMATLKGIFHFERKFLSPFLQNLINRIREKHPDLWLFFEPSALGPNQGFRTDLKKLYDPRKGDARLVFFPHIYTLDLDIKGRYAGNPFHINFWARRRKREARKFKTPMMTGEFGLSESKPGALQFLEEVTTMFDRITSGWFYWAYDETRGWGLTNPDGSEQEKCNVLVRPYPRAIAGTGPRFSWDSKKRVFRCSYQSAKENGLSEFYLPERCWPEGWDLEISVGKAEWDFDNEKHVLSIRSKSEEHLSLIIKERAKQ